MAITRVARAGKRSYGAIAREYGVAASTVCYWAQKDHTKARVLVSEAKNAAKAARRRPKAGKKGKNPRLRRLIVSLAQEIVQRDGHTRYKHPTARSIAAELVKRGEPALSKWTVHRELRGAGLVSRVRPRVPTTVVRDEQRRLAFVKANRSIDPKRLVFSDEKIFTCNDTTSRRVWIYPGTKVIGRESTRFPARVMVWAAIGHNFLTYRILYNPKDDNCLRTVTAAYYQRALLPLISTHVRNNGLMFMQDGANPHRARSTIEALERRRIPLLTDWPARSPDLNPIETFWALVQREVSQHFPVTYKELITTLRAVFDRWAREEMEQINRLVASFTDRCKSVMRKQGGF